jgi:hypothetical protein
MIDRGLTTACSERRSAPPLMPSVRRRRASWMERIESKYRDGVAEAERDIAAGQPKLRYGARGAWGPW